MPETQPGQGMPDFREARRPTRIYSGTTSEGEAIVTVRDFAGAADKDGCRPLEPGTSRLIRDFCERFEWPCNDAGRRQLALALLFDVTGDADRALTWCELFAERYVSKLPESWTVPEIDIELWLYCFENARPGS